MVTSRIVLEIRADELYSTDHHNVADGITTCRSDYAGVPRHILQLWSAAAPVTSVDRSLLLKASRRRAALIRTSSAGIRRPKQPASHLSASDQWTRSASVRDCGCWKSGSCHRNATTGARWIVQNGQTEACLRQRLLRDRRTVPFLLTRSPGRPHRMSCRLDGHSAP